MAKKKPQWEWQDPIIDLRPDYHLAMGQLLQRWAQLEYQLQEVIWYGMGISEKQGRMLTVGMSMDAIWGTVRNVAKNWIKDPSDQAIAKKISDRMQDFQDARKYIAHGRWQSVPQN